MTERDELLNKIDHAAVDLISTRFAGLSTEAIKTRMCRIADDLTYEMRQMRL